MKNVGRKIYHALGGPFLLGIYYALDRRPAFAVFLALFFGILAFDLARLWIPSFGRWTQKRLGTLLRPGEANTLSGSPTYILGVALTLLFFELPIATAAVLFLAFGDVSATVVGEFWGRTKFGDKSLEGSAAFIVGGLLAGSAASAAGYGPPPPVLAFGVAVAAAAEAFTPRSLNDNLSVPLLSAAAMTLLGRMVS